MYPLNSYDESCGDAYELQRLKEFLLIDVFDGRVATAPHWPVSLLVLDAVLSCGAASVPTRAQWRSLEAKTWRQEVACEPCRLLDEVAQLRAVRWWLDASKANTSLMPGVVAREWAEKDAVADVVRLVMTEDDVEKEHKAGPEAEQQQHMMTTQEEDRTLLPVPLSLMASSANRNAQGLVRLLRRLEKGGACA